MNKSVRFLNCGKGTITYTLVRKPVKNINLRIRNGEITVSAAPRVPISYIESFIASKYDFIMSGLESKKRSEPERDKLYNSGDTLLFDGKSFTLEIRHGEEDSIILNGSTFLLTTYDEEDTIYINKLIRNWYYNRTMELFKRLNDEVYGEFSQKYNVPHASVRVKYMSSRWGSCKMSDGVLSMNSRLIYYPEMTVKAVFVHEYAHFIVPDHSANFYRVVTSIMPDYKKWDSYLK